MLMRARIMADSAVVNALTIDVEDYFHAHALAPHLPRHAWDELPCRVERNIDRLLAVLHDVGAVATFFTLGWVAERYPLLVRRIVAAGHELASHGHAHHRATDQSPGEFRADVARAKAVLEDATGVAVIGYRAPSFSIGPQHRWAYECLAAAGYRYSSSIYPIRHDHYGAPDAPRFEHESHAGVVELPITTVRVLNRNWPAGGGGYFRLFPYEVTRWAIRRVNRIDARPAIFYFHPWEIDPDQPRVAGASARTRLRHYLNLARTEGRLRRLLGDFRWDRLDRVYGIAER